MSLPGVFDGDFIDDITRVQDKLQLTKYLAVVSFTILLYDWAATLDLEVEFIWGTPWSLGRFTYHMNRIWPIIFLSTTLPLTLFASSTIPVCRRAVFLYAYGTVIQLSLISSVFLVRCWALYGERRLLWGLSLALACAVGCSIILVELSMNRAIYLLNPLPTLITDCSILLPPGVWTIYLPPTIYQFIVFVLTSWRIWKMNRDHGTTPLAQRLAQNGTFYFALLLALIAFACVGSASESIRFASSGSGMAAAVSSVVCSRMALSLHEFSQIRYRNRSIISDGIESLSGHDAPIALSAVPSLGKSKGFGRFEPS